MVTASDEWLTPREIIEALGPFDLDPACAPNMPWATAPIVYTAADDGLSKIWPSHARVFLNPPYSKALIGRFMRRMAEHNHGTALVNARTDTAWFTRYVWQAATAVLFIYQRVRFIQASNMEIVWTGKGSSVLVAYGNHDADRLADSGIEGAYLPLATRTQVVAVYRPETGQTWLDVVTQLVDGAGGTVTLAAAYVLIAGHPKRAANNNWQAKVRQVLQGPQFRRIAAATYRLGA